MGQHTLHAVKKRRAKACGQSRCHAFNHSTYRVAFFFCRKDGCFHLLVKPRSQHRQRHAVQCRRIHVSAIQETFVLKVLQLLDMRTDGYPLHRKILPAQRTCQHNGCRQPAAEVSTAAPVLKTKIAHMSCVIRMTRACEIHPVAIILRAGVGIADDGADGLTGGAPLHHTTEKLRLIGFLSRCCKRAVSRSAPRHFCTQRLHFNIHTCRKTIHADSDSFPMALPEKGQPKLLAEKAAHSACPPNARNTSR